MTTSAHVPLPSATAVALQRSTLAPVELATPTARRHFRSIFISDLHLGSAGARAVEVLRFLRGLEVENLYLVGDIFDIWHVGLVKWTPVHDQILLEIIRLASQGTRVVYLPGNHDAAMRSFIGIGAKILNTGSFELADQITHQTADGKRYLVLHGDQCDLRPLKWHILTRIGSRFDGWLRRLDDHLKRLTGRRSRGSSAWIDTLRGILSAAMSVGGRSEIRLAEFARRTEHHGVICGHFHRPAMHDHDGITYVNCGDWVDNRSAVVEHHDGRLQLLEIRDRPAYSRAMGTGFAGAPA